MFKRNVEKNNKSVKQRKFVATRQSVNVTLEELMLDSVIKRLTLSELGKAVAFNRTRTRSGLKLFPSCSIV